MAKRKSKEEKIALLEQKYSARIAKIVKAYENRTMGELWERLDKLKEQLAKELEQIEHSGHQVDTKDAFSDER